MDVVKGSQLPRWSWSFQLVQCVMLALVVVLMHHTPETMAGNPDAKRLYDDLLSNYNKLVRPVVNVSEPVTVRLKLKLSQLIDVVSGGPLRPIWKSKRVWACVEENLEQAQPSSFPSLRWIMIKLSYAVGGRTKQRRTTNWGRTSTKSPVLTRKCQCLEVSTVHRSGWLTNEPNSLVRWWNSIRSDLATNKMTTTHVGPAFCVFFFWKSICLSWCKRVLSEWSQSSRPHEMKGWFEFLRQIG